jgi:hypothetical protein
MALIAARLSLMQPLIVSRAFSDWLALDAEEFESSAMEAAISSTALEIETVD